MAFDIVVGGPVLVTMTFFDESGNDTQKRVVVDFDTDLATTLANAGDVIDDYQAGTDAHIEATVSLPFEDSAPVAAQAGSEVEMRAAISLGLVTDATHLQKKQTLEIPAPKIGMFVATTGSGKNVVDITDALVTAIVANYRATGGVASIGDGQKVLDGANGLISGKRVHKASRKG